MFEFLNMFLHDANFFTKTVITGILLIALLISYFKMPFGNISKFNFIVRSGKSKIIRKETDH